MSAFIIIQNSVPEIIFVQIKNMINYLLVIVYAKSPESAHIWTYLPLQQRLQILEKRVVRVRCVRDRLEAAEPAVLGAHEIIQHPVFAPLHNLRPVVAIKAIDATGDASLGGAERVRVARVTLIGVVSDDDQR